MDKEVLRRVRGQATRIVYDSDLEYYSRMVRGIMSVCSDVAMLEPYMIGVLSVLCKMERDGVDWRVNGEVVRCLSEYGYGRIANGTWMNYKSHLKRKGWVVVLQGGRLSLNGLLMRGVTNGGLEIGWFMKDVDG